MYFNKKIKDINIAKNYKSWFKNKLDNCLFKKTELYDNDLHENDLQNK